jgi:glycosyltransferase involved in cell wall biosynthesis
VTFPPLAASSISRADLTIVHWAKYYTPEPGGMESVTQVLAEGAAEAGHAVTVVCFTRGKGGNTKMQGVQVQRAAHRLAPSSQPLSWAYVKLAWQAARHADLVHLHAPNLLGALLATLLSRRVRLLVHWHSDIVGKGMLGRLVKPLERALLRRADLVVATSPPYAAASPMLRAVADKVIAVPLGSPKPCPVTGHPERDFSAFLGHRRLILSLGRLVPYKGFPVLVQAAAMLPDDCAVIIGGTGPLTESLQALVLRLGLEQRVLLPGRLSDTELEVLLRLATVFCLPSVERSEAFGVVLLEAMARGVPCVATRIEGSGTSWVNEDGVSGLNVTPGDVASLTAALARICADKALRARLSDGAQRRWSQHFTDTGFVRAFNDAYRALARPGR